jgi:hypothetical protein
MRVMGLDVSTAIVGCTVMSLDASGPPRLELAEAAHLSKHETTYGKSCAIRESIERWSSVGPIDLVVVEEPLQRFTRGLSSMKTISALIRFNGIVCFLAEDILRCEVRTVSVNHARKDLGLIIPKGSKDVKERVVDWVGRQPEFSSYAWPEKLLRSGPRRGQTVPDPSCFDIADSAVMCLHGIRTNKR